MTGGPGGGHSREVMSGTSFSGTGRGKPVGVLGTVQSGSSPCKALDARTNPETSRGRGSEGGVSGRKRGQKGSASRLGGLRRAVTLSDSEARGSLGCCGDPRAESDRQWEDSHPVGAGRGDAGRLGPTSCFCSRKWLFPFVPKSLLWCARGPQNKFVCV